MDQLLGSTSALRWHVGLLAATLGVWLLLTALFKLLLLLSVQLKSRVGVTVRQAQLAESSELLFDK